MNETEKCKVCNSKIDFDNYFVNSNEEYYLCSEKCSDKITDDEIWQVKYCSAYDECKQLNNLREMCVFEEKYTGSSLNLFTNT